MTQMRPLASLSSGLLARKGAAKPAMRPQSFGPVGIPEYEDLGWNDMGHGGHDHRRAQPMNEHVPSSIAALTPAPRPIHAGPAPVADQQRAIADSFRAVEEEKAFVPASTPARPAQVVALPARQAVQGKCRKSAFTLRLDPDRHYRLKLACAVTGKSAQQIVQAALDRWLDACPEVETLANVPVSGAGRN